jgi:hypothetical protein
METDRMSKPRAGSAHAAPGDPGARSRPDSRTLVRRIAAALTAVALGAGLALVGVAAPASAHHNTITAAAVCDDASGTFDITWTVENSETVSETITSTSNPSLVAKNTRLGSHESKTFVQSDVPAGTYELKLGAKWDNGNTQSNVGTVEVKAAACDDESVKKITFCHATGSSSNPYEKLTTSVNAFFQAGHDTHQDKRDIYPAFSYVKQGKTYDVAAQGDQSLLQYEDCVKPPTKVEVPTATFSDACGVDNYVLTYDAALEGVTWTKVVEGGTLTLTATVKAGYVFADGKSVAEVKAELREQNADIAKRLVDRTGWSHGRVNGELNRLAGLASVGGATNAQLRSRLKQGEKWLKT